MFRADFTHHGEDCTFETMPKQFGLVESKGLREIAENDHDVDLKDDKFHRLEGCATIVRFKPFLAGASAAIVGVIIVVSLDLIPAALVDLPTITVALIGFLVIIVMKIDVAKVALGAMAGGILYAVTRGLY